MSASAARRPWPARDRPPLAGREVGLVAAALGVLLLVLADRYGPHRDELYFAAAGQRLAWGYPDQPSGVAFLARLADGVAPGDLVVLRLPSLVAMVALVVTSAGFARLLGGGRAAQVLTAVTVAAGGLTVALGHRLSTATFEVLLWTAILLVVGHAVVEDRPRLWLLAGLLAGLGLNIKHSLAFCLFGLLVGVALVRPTRRVLGTRYPWLAGLLALVLWLPNLIWQTAAGWPALELSADIAAEFGGGPGRVAMLGEALLMFSPVIGAVWVLGLWRLLRDPRWLPLRPVAIAFLAVLGLLLVTGGKGYYLGGAIPPLIAAGCVALAERWPVRRLAVTGVVLAASAAVAWPALIPVLPERVYAASPYTALQDDQVETIGWPELAAAVRAELAALPVADRGRAVVFTGNYGQAGALEWYGVDAPVYSGHNGWRDWGPPPDTAAPVLLVGVAPGTEFTDCVERRRVYNAVGAENEEYGVRLTLCADVAGSWAEQWPTLVHLDA